MELLLMNSEFMFLHLHIYNKSSVFETYNSSYVEPQRLIGGKSNLSFLKGVELHIVLFSI